MTSYQIRVLAAFVRTESFIKQSGGGELFASPRNRGLTQELSLIVVRINELSRLEDTKPKPASSQGLNGLGRELRDELLKVTRTSRILEDEAPQLRSLFSMPRSPGFSQLLKTAREFIANTPPEVEALFIENELRPDYLQLIEEKLQRLESVMDKQSEGRKKRVSVTTEVRESFARGMSVLRKLDAAFRNKVSDPSSLDAWRIARNVELLHRPSSRRPRKSVETPQPEITALPQDPVPAAPEPIAPVIEVDPPEATPEGVPPVSDKEPEQVVPSEPEFEESATPAGSEKEEEVEPAEAPKPARRRRVAVEKSMQEDFFGTLNP